MATKVKSPQIDQLNSPKINEDVAMTATSTELNVLDGITTTTAELNLLHGKLGAWTAFTPSWTNLTPGSGTNEGRYCQIGKTVFFRVYFNMGSGSSMGTVPTLTLPVSASGNWGIFAPIGNVIIEDSGTTLYIGIIMKNGQIYVQDASATALKYLQITSTSPMTWTTNDNLQITGFYEAA